MRLFVSGSAPLLAETHKEFAGPHRPRHPRALRHDRDQHEHLEPLRRRAPSRARVGFPLPGVEVRVADPETGAALAPGEVGVIEVRGPNVFTGYWRMPEKTAEEFRADGFFVTGDLGDIDARRLRPHRRPRPRT